MGTVFEAERLADGARVALKRIDRSTRDELAATRIAREVRAANAVSSEHIVRVLDVGTDDGCPFLVMERLVGEDLGARLRREGRVGEEDAIAIASQVLAGLAEAHAQGVIHRDLKPDNVFLAAAPPCVKILDFGMSKMQALGGTVPLAVTLRGTAIGTPLYMSPEQAAARPDVDARSDIYSVGAMLFECLTGRPPHVGETDDEVIASIRKTPAPKVGNLEAGVDPGLGEVIDRALAFDPGARVGSAREMRVALEGCGGRSPVEAAGRRTSVRTWVAAGGALALGIIVTVLAALLIGATR
jgi:serine/threonine protein kinase